MIVRLWDVQTGRLKMNFLGHESYVDSIAISSDGTKLVSGSLDKTVRLWDVQKGQLIGAPLSSHRGVEPSALARTAPRLYLVVKIKR